MKKTIILSNGVKKEMTYEEVVKQFTPMINRQVNIALEKFSKANLEREDLLQDMKLEAWNAFNEYDGHHAFSTILTFKLKKVTGNLAQHVTRKKRKSLGVLSMNAAVGDSEDLTLENMFPEEDYAAENMIAAEMMELIKKSLNDREKEELLCILYPLDHSASKLAEARGISRQACNQRVKKTRAKLQELLIANNFVA
jgi:RNA polymerase sigma factor (sigma-70 family)